MKNRIKLDPATIVIGIFFVIAAIFLMMPFYFMFLSSLKPGTEILRLGLSFKIEPDVMSFNNYNALNTYRDGIYWAWYKSSLTVMLLQTAVGLFFASIVGYALAMYNFRGKTLLFGLVLLMMTTPMEILMLPLFLEMQKLHLYGSIWSVILPQITAPLPVFFFRQYLVGLPKDYLDAARVDGCTEYGIFFRIIMPLMKPSFAAMGIFVGMNSWNAFILPVLLLAKENRTLPVFLETLLSPYKNNYDLLIVGAVFSVIPILILFAMFQRHFIAGMTAGGVKE